MVEKEEPSTTLRSQGSWQELGPRMEREVLDEDLSSIHQLR